MMFKIRPPFKIHAAVKREKIFKLGGEIIWIWSFYPPRPFVVGGVSLISEEFEMSLDYFDRIFQTK